MRTKDLAINISYFTEELKHNTQSLVATVEAIKSGEDEETTTQELYDMFIEMQSNLESMDRDFQECFNE